MFYLHSYAGKKSLKASFYNAAENSLTGVLTYFKLTIILP